MKTTTFGRRMLGLVMCEGVMSTDWKKQQAECKKCKGTGYQQSEMRHENNRQPHAWAARCECQPQSMVELEEAAAQEAAYNARVKGLAGEA